jgi:hypothetical protein
MKGRTRAVQAQTMRSHYLQHAALIVDVSSVETLRCW